MKKWIAIFLLVAMMLSLVACRSEEKETQAVETTAAEEQVPEETAETSETEEEIKEETITEEITTEEITETETDLAHPETFWAEEDVEYPITFYFSSGAGAWYTALYLNEDGSFTGSFHDANQGEGGEGYYGTVYESNFSGKFGLAERLDMYTYSTKLLELTLDRPQGEEWIQDETKYISWTPYGLENCESFLIYLPNTPVNLLAEDTYYWWPGRYYEDYTTLHGYGLMNIEDGSCFFAMLEEESFG